jgi:hypothetical protein
MNAEQRKKIKPEARIRAGMAAGSMVGATGTAGAIIGSLLLPGVGTVIGLGIGAALGTGAAAITTADKEKDMKKLR